MGGISSSQSIQACLRSHRRSRESQQNIHYAMFQLKAYRIAEHFVNHFCASAHMLICWIAGFPLVNTMWTENVWTRAEFQGIEMEMGILGSLLRGFLWPAVYCERDAKHVNVLSCRCGIMRREILNAHWRATLTRYRISRSTKLENCLHPAPRTWLSSCGISKALNASEPCMVRHLS